MQKLRQVDNKKIIKTDNQKKDSKANKSNLNHSRIKKNEPSTFEKLERLIKDDTSEGKAQWDKVKNKEISVDKGFQNIEKIELVKKSIIKNTVDNFRVTGEDYEKKNKPNMKQIRDALKKVKTKSLQNENILKKMYICKRCPKATVMTIECECEECGHLNLTPKVLCDDDMTNGSRRLRDPNSELCKNSPHYDLLVRN